jgi:hypothetical protein
MLVLTVSPSNVTVDYVTSAPGQASNGQVAYSYTIMPNEGDNAPVAYDQAMSTSEGVSVPVSLNASDIDGDVLSYQVVDSPSHGSLSGDAPDLVYTPDAGFTGLDGFTFKANDGVKDSNVACVSVTVSSEASCNLLLMTVPNQGSYSGRQNVAFNVDVFNQRSSALNSTLTLSVSGPDGYGYFDFQNVAVLAKSVGEYSFVWRTPQTAGTYVVEVELVAPLTSAYDAVWLDVV